MPVRRHEVLKVWRDLPLIRFSDVSKILSCSRYKVRLLSDQGKLELISRGDMIYATGDSVRRFVDGEAPKRKERPRSECGTYLPDRQNVNQNVTVD